MRRLVATCLLFNRRAPRPFGASSAIAPLLRILSGHYLILIWSDLHTPTLYFSSWIGVIRHQRDLQGREEDPHVRLHVESREDHPRASAFPFLFSRSL